VTVLSADWVVPVEGAPIRDGAVEIDDETGTIAAVGRREELGDSVHHEQAVILPGFVDAHTHLEYDGYAGFGDGLRFAEWIGLHVQRKARIGLEDMEAIARAGVARTEAFGHHDTVLRLGLALRYARYTVGLSREESAGGFDPTYQFVLSGIFR